jgi:hypothetical protein
MRPLSLSCVNESHYPGVVTSDGNVILLNTHDHDRSTHDETSYPLTNPLSIHYHSIL